MQRVVQHLGGEVALTSSDAVRGWGERLHVRKLADRLHADQPVFRRAEGDKLPVSFVDAQLPGLYRCSSSYHPAQGSLRLRMLVCPSLEVDTTRTLQCWTKDVFEVCGEAVGVVEALAGQEFGGKAWSGEEAGDRTHAALGGSPPPSVRFPPLLDREPLHPVVKVLRPK